MKENNMKLVEIAMFTDKVAETTAFYRTLLGADPGYANQDMATFMNNGVKIFIHKMYTPGEGDLPPENHHAFEVEDLDAAVAALISQGLQVEVQPRDFYWGRSAYLRSPNHQLIELIQASQPPGT